MELVTMYIPLFLSGLGLYGVWFSWRWASARWGNWVGIVRKIARWSLMALSAVLVVCTLKSYDGILMNNGAAVLTFVLGVGLPELALFRRRGSAGASPASKTGTGKGGVPALSAKDLARRIKADRFNTSLTLGGVPLPVQAETTHILLAGDADAGRATALSSLLGAIRARGDTIIVVDGRAELLAQHFDDESDFVFNPFDARCVAWTPLAEMHSVSDANQVAKSIIPSGPQFDPAVARTFVSAVLRRLWELDRLTLPDFLYLVQVAPRSELSALLAGTPAARYVVTEQDLAPVRAVVSAHVQTYDHLVTGDPVFSVAEMVQAEHSGVLYLTYQPDQLDALRPLISTLLDAAARAVSQLSPSADRRVWLIVDNLTTLGHVPILEAVASESNDTGCCLVLGLQSLTPLAERHGDAAMQSLLAKLATRLVLRTAERDTAEQLAKALRGGEGTSSSKADTARPSELQASHIRALAPPQGFLKVAGGYEGGYPTASVKLVPLPRSAVTAATYVARDFNELPLLDMRATTFAPRTVTPAYEPPPAPAQERRAAEVVRPVAVPVPVYHEPTANDEPDANLEVEPEASAAPDLAAWSAGLTVPGWDFEDLDAVEAAGQDAQADSPVESVAPSPSPVLTPAPTPVQAEVLPEAPAAEPSAPQRELVEEVRTVTAPQLSQGDQPFSVDWTPPDVSKLLPSARPAVVDVTSELAPTATPVPLSDPTPEAPPEVPLVAETRAEPTSPAERTARPDRQPRQERPERGDRPARPPKAVPSTSPAVPDTRPRPDRPNRPRTEGPKGPPKTPPASNAPRGKNADVFSAMFK